jgi:hypothetical protein
MELERVIRSAFFVREMFMYEVKADALEESFDAVLQAEKIAALEADVSALKGQVVAAQRPALDGVKGDAADPQRAVLRRPIRRTSSSTWCRRCARPIARGRRS